MSNENNTILLEDYQETDDYKLKNMAGMVFSGFDDEGEPEWIGDSEKHKKYEELQKKFDNGEIVLDFPF